MIKRETIDKIFETARIEEVIGEFVQLKKSGSNYKGLSPFTNEKTPSFTVSPAKQIFKCFSSGKGGNVVTFLMESEHFTYPDALRWLAERYQIEIEETQVTDEEKAQRDERESVFLVSAFAEKYFEEQLKQTDEGKGVGLSYFRQRGFTQKTIETFHLGYSPEQRDAFTKHALSQGYSKEFLEKSGISIFRNESGFDRFSGRVMFPIHSISGRVLGFGGRILKTNAKAAKYLNSPENPIYHKSKVLYGIFQAKSAIAKADNCYLVEGYTDVVSLHQAGVENVVASSGTALTPDQIRLVSRLTQNLTILYDGDAAGIRAALRGTQIALEQGMHVRVVLFPDGEDPDSYAQNHTQEELETFLKEASQDIVQFQTNLLLKEAQNDPVKKADLLRDVLETIALVKEDTLQTLYIQQTARSFEMDERTLFNELARIQGKKQRDEDREASRQNMRAITETPDQATQKPRLRSNPEIDQERAVIRVLLNHGQETMTYEFEQDTEDGNQERVEAEVNVASFMVDEIEVDSLEFHDPIFREIYAQFIQGLNEEKVPGVEQFARSQNPEIARTTSDLVSEKHELSPNWKAKGIVIHPKESYLTRDVFESLYYFKRAKVDRMLRELTAKLKSPVENQNTFELMEKIKAFKAIEQSLRKIITEKRF